MIQFILGKSGTGKTTLCIKQIVSALLDKGESRPLVFLVPEQATYQAERAILSSPGLTGFSRLSVLSFQRLAFLLHGKNLAGSQLTPSARQMIITRLLMQNSDKLQVFGSASKKPGTISGVARIITELQHYSKSPQDINELIQKFSQEGFQDSSRLKFADINLIYTEYLNFIDSRFINPDSHIKLARQAVADAEFLKNAVVWVDGFAGFTTSEMELLIEVVKTSALTKIAICLDPDSINVGYPEVQPLEASSMFSLTERTYCRIVELLRQAKVPLADPVILRQPFRFKKSRALAHLEKNIFTISPAQKISAENDIEIVSAAKPRIEVEFVARQIQILVRQKNYRWRDISVITPDIETYRHYITAIFGDYNIPFFLDRRRGLQQYPAVELISSAIKIATGRFSTSDVFNFLKCDLVPSVTRREVDVFENYCLAFGIDSKDFLSGSDWEYARKDDPDFDQAQINGIRHRALDELFCFRASLQSFTETDAVEFCRVFLEFLDKIHLKDTLNRWIQLAVESSDNELAQTHQQFVSKFARIITEFLEIFKHYPISISDCGSVIISAFSQMTLALIPPGLDQVLVGSIERSRHPDLKAVFLVGTSQRLFPSAVSYDNILSEKDRDVAESLGLKLSDSLTQKLIDRRYLAYIAFTRPAEKLYISYPLADEKGSEIQPCSLLEDIKSLFTDLSEHLYYRAPTASDIYSEHELAELLCSASPLQYDHLLPPMLADARLSELGEFVKNARAYDKRAELTDEFVKSFFIGDLQTSASRLASFAACPFKYFSQYILKLKPRRLFELEPLDLGQFYHACLENLFDSLYKRGENFASCSNEELARLVQVAIEGMKSENSFLRCFSNRSNHNRSIIESVSEMLVSAVTEISAIQKAGLFRQLASEVAFSNKSQLPPYTLELSEGRKVNIHGKIDRIDVFRQDGQNLALIFDYKKSEKPMDYSLIAAGLDVQLLIYALALKGRSLPGCENIQPIGAFYLPIEKWPQSRDLYDVPNQLGKIARKPKGFFDGSFYQLLDNNIDSGYSRFYNFRYIKKDESVYGSYETTSAFRPEDFESFFKFALKKIKAISRDILAGTITVTPYRLAKKTPCAYCNYKSFCRFDWQIKGYREISKKEKSELFEQGGSCE